MLTPLETIICEWLLSAAALFSVAARLLVRLFTLRQHQHHGRSLCLCLCLWLSDSLLVAGLGCAFGSSACDTLVYRLGALQAFDDPSAYLGKIRFVRKVLFDTGLYLPKLSLVLSYEMMVTKMSRMGRFFLGCIKAYLIMACVTATFVTIFWCGADPSINWQHPQTCSSLTSGYLQKVTWTLNILGDLLLLIFPFSIQKSLRFSTSLRDKLGLALVFTLGIITIIVTTGSFITMAGSSHDISLSVWTTAETSVSLMGASAMVLAPGLGKIRPEINFDFQKLRVLLPKWRLRIVREEQLLPSSTRQKSDQICGKYSDGDDTDGLPMPKPTATWFMWPVDLDVDSMSVTAVTETNIEVMPRENLSSPKQVLAAKSTPSRSLRDKSSRRATQASKECLQAESISRGTQTLGRVVVELDPEGLPYGSTFVDSSPA